MRALKEEVKAIKMEAAENRKKVQWCEQLNKELTETTRDSSKYTTDHKDKDE